MDLREFLSDNGFSSRKLWICVGGLVLLTAMVIVGCHCAAIAGMYAEYVGGVLGVLGIYTGTNIAGRMSNAKHIGSKLADAANDSSDDTPEGDPSSKPPIEPHPEEER
jgi:hypothetical protein